MTATLTNRYQCKACRHAAPVFAPQCKGCKAWDTYQPCTPTAAPAAGVTRMIDPLPGVRQQRVPCGLPWLDKAFAGGLVRGQRVLLGGQEGAGKTRLLLQLAHAWALSMRRVLIVSGEMQPADLQAVARQLGAVHANMLLTGATDLDKLGGMLKAHNPAAVLVDSLNMLVDPGRRGDAGSNGQMKHCLARLGRLCSTARVPVVFLAHLNARDAISGPRWLRHEVDAVALLSIDKHGRRLLKVSKNRHGPETQTSLTMTAKGLEP
ncbi:MAG: AAA family ATPase [Planctomycetota bacterium]|nr:AAA family ATPase [Planctomycetota bacterium]